MIYAIVKDKGTGDERRVEIMQKVQRSKAGPTGKFESVFNWAKGAREWIKDNGNAMEKEKNESIRFLGNIISETKQNSLHYHWAKAEEDYPVDQFIREINEGSLI